MDNPLNKEPESRLSEISILELWFLLKKHSLSIAVFIFIGVGIASFFIITTPKKYRAGATISKPPMRDIVDLQLIKLKMKSVFPDVDIIKHERREIFDEFIENLKDQRIINAFSNNTPYKNAFQPVGSKQDENYHGATKRPIRIDDRLYELGKKRTINVYFSGEKRGNTEKQLRNYLNYVNQITIADIVNRIGMTVKIYTDIAQNNLERLNKTSENVNAFKLKTTNEKDINIYLDQNLEFHLSNRLMILNQLLTDLVKIDKLSAYSMMISPKVSTVQIQPKTSKILIIGACLGLITGLLFALIRYALSQA